MDRTDWVVHSFDKRLFHSTAASAVSQATSHSHGVVHTHRIARLKSSAEPHLSFPKSLQKLWSKFGFKIILGNQNYGSKKNGRSKKYRV